METGIQLGVMLWCQDLADLQAKVGAAASAGYRCCQATLLWAITPGEAAVAEEYATRSGVEIVAFGTYVNLLRPDDETFCGARIDTAYGLAEAMRSLRCRRLVVWSGSYGRRVDDAVPANWTAEAGEAALAEAESLATRLRNHGAFLCIEPYHTHVLRTPAAYAAFVRQVDRDVARVVLDPPNFVSPEEYDLFPEMLPEIVRTLAPVTGLIHLKDICRRADGTLDRPRPGRGTMDYTRFLTLTREHGISAPAIVESVDDRSVPEMQEARLFVEGHLSAAGISLL